ncbi:MAG: MFS transporter [Propionibacteriaceae bacterium]|jgi:MFS family permease|nr:MFS transporter [Propionibacteriaceae bacterium]
MGIWEQPSTARFLTAAYGPTLFASFGYGAAIPMIAIQAKELGATLGIAAFVAALTGVGQLVADLPAGVIAERFGERRPLMIACLLDAVVLAAAFWAHSLWLFACLVFVHGCSGAVFALARQTYLTVAVPLKYRARAMSSLGGVFRVGNVLGPLAGAAITATHTTAHAFLLAAVMSLLAAIITVFMPDLPTNNTAAQVARESIWTILYQHRRMFISLGMAMLSLSLIRAARQTILPLWCDQHGLNISTTNLVYAASMAPDVLLFFPGGMIMDRLGRFWVSVPTMFAMSLGFAVLPFATTLLPIIAVAVWLGISNGVSAGIFATLGADLSPSIGRAQFLSGWRVFGDIGTALGPGVISFVTLFAPLSVAAGVLAAIGVAGGLRFCTQLPRRGALSPSVPEE